jgi:pimeloyl-ACP methyl ester carboxylesterase
MTRRGDFRLYGDAPFGVAVIHGGPGAPGEMATVAGELSGYCGVLEPFQTEPTLEGQLRELREVLEKEADLPVVLVGHSWGAMLGYIFAAGNPALVRKLVMVDSAVFDDKYAIGISETRMSRLNEEDRARVGSLSSLLRDPAAKDKDEAFRQLGEYIEKADAFDPVPYESEVVEYQYDVFKGVWPEAEEMRRSGRLLALGEEVRCPVVAIHGDYDPHPAEGVREPLSRVLRDFSFVLLGRCGHRPWLERAAKDEFYRILRQELKGNRQNG